MELFKKELYDQYQKQIKGATFKFGLLNIPGVLGILAFTLFFKPVGGGWGMLIALCLYVLYTTIVCVPYFIEVLNLQKDYKQQITDLSQLTDLNQ